MNVNDIHYGDILIPGGWEARVPRITVVREDARFREMVVAFQRWGNRPLAAEDLARAACEDVFTSKWITSLRAFVARAAIRHIAEGGTMETFRPEIAQRAYVPGLDDVMTPGKGNMFLKEVLREMRS